MNEETINIENVLHAVNDAFETELIGCMDKDDGQKRIRVADLRRLVKRAIQCAEINKMIHANSSGIMKDIF